jgi:hypothetical protein
VPDVQFQNELRYRQPFVRDTYSPDELIPWTTPGDVVHSNYRTPARTPLSDGEHTFDDVVCLNGVTPPKIGI